MGKPLLGYGKRRLITEIIKKTWEVENPEDVKLSYNDVLYILQEMEDEEGKKYLEEDYSMRRGHHVFKEFTKQLLYRNLANYDSMILITSEKGCITGDALLYTPEYKEGKPLIELVNKGPIKVYSYNIETKKIEEKISDGVEYVKTCNVYTLKLKNNMIITGTYDHPVLTPNGYKKLKTFKENEEVITNKGIQKVHRVEHRGIEDVYDVVNVQDNHNFICNGFVISNTGKSSLSIMLSREWCRLIGIRFDPNRHMAYSNQDVVNKIDMLNKFEPLVCLTGDTLVKIKYKDKEYEERIDNLIHMKDYEVLTYNTNKNIYEYKKPEKTILQPEKKAAYTIELENGYKIKATENHLVLTKKGYKKIKDLTDTDEVKVFEKTCPYCGKTFNKNIRRRIYCSENCSYESYKKENRGKNIEYLKKYRLINKDELKKKRDERRDIIRENHRKYYKNNKKFRQWCKEYNKKYHTENKERLRELNKKWIKNNYNRYREYLNNKHKILMKEDVDYKIKRNLRRRVGLALKDKGIIKDKSLLEYIGCSIIELKKHLESKFKDNMSWDNYGKWHVDHVIPCCHFTLSKKEEQKKCFNYKNLQPLWEKDNLQKGGKI